MIAPDFLARLRCPISSDSLVEMSPGELAALNGRILAKGVRTRADVVVERPLSAALQTGSGWVYAIQDGIPVLLADEAIRV